MNTFSNSMMDLVKGTVHPWIIWYKCIIMLIKRTQNPNLKITNYTWYHRYNSNYWRVAITASLNGRLYGRKEKVMCLRWHQDYVAIWIPTRACHRCSGFPIPWPFIIFPPPTTTHREAVQKDGPKIVRGLSLSECITSSEEP